MEQAATFLLAWQSAGSDGYLHAVANAHETQWSVPDPATDIAADQALFPATISAATLLGTDSALAAQLRTALGQIEPYPRTDASTHSQLLNPQPTSASAAASADAKGNDVIADSYQPIRRQPQPGERRPGTGLALRGHRRQHRRQRRQPHRAGRPDLQQPAVPEPAGLDV